jgi:hypothetical protein
MRKGLLISTLLFSSISFAESFETVSLRGAKIELSSEFTQNEIKVIKRDLDLLYQIPKFDIHSEIHSSLFPGVRNGKGYFDWLVKRISYFARGNNKNLREFPFIAEHVTGRRGKEKINIVLLYRNYFEELNPYKRLSTLIHEAKHAEGDIFSHVTCSPYVIDTFKTDRLNKISLTPVCDQSWDSSYGAELIFSFNITKVLGKSLTDITPETSSAAGRIMGTQSRCELNMEFWPDRFHDERDCI